MERFKVSVCPREQQRAFELAENSGSDNFRIVGFDTETLKPTLDCVLSPPECVAGRGAEDLGLPRGFQRGGRNRTTFLVIGALEVRRHTTRNAREEGFDILRRLDRLGNGPADAFRNERQGSLADFLLAFWKMEIERAARSASHVENVVERRAVINLLAKQSCRCDQCFLFRIRCACSNLRST